MQQNKKKNIYICTRSTILYASAEQRGCTPFTVFILVAEYEWIFMIIVIT